MTTLLIVLVVCLFLLARENHLYTKQTAEQLAQAYQKVYELQDKVAAIERQLEGRLPPRAPWPRQ